MKAPHAAVKTLIEPKLQRGLGRRGQEFPTKPLTTSGGLLCFLGTEDPHKLLYPGLPLGLGAQRLPSASRYEGHAMQNVTCVSAKLGDCRVSEMPGVTTRYGLNFSIGLYSGRAGNQPRM